ncbi:MAG: indole-3-glycerol phosphate synthase TrpC [Bacteroidota bacterium]
MHILEQIVNYKQREVAERKHHVPFRKLERIDSFNRETNSFLQAIKEKDASGVIAEFKRKSPSKQAINLNADPVHVARGYVKAKASAISVLTDEHFFGGHDRFLQDIREACPETPLLRKEFIIDEYQILEAKSLGADIVLLICEILKAAEVHHLASLARDLGMEVLLELHSESQLDKYSDAVTMVGVNNRDLTTFEVDYDRSKKLFDRLPQDVVKVAESGLSETDTLVMLHAYGFRGFLIGEQFMKQADPGEACHGFISDFLQKRDSHVA